MSQRHNFREALGLLIWDLDGTLIDSRADLTTSLNLTLAELRRPPLSDEQVARYMGNGARVLVQRALGLLPEPAYAAEAPPATPLDPADEALGERGLELFIRFYDQHKLDQTCLYAGVADGLRSLAEAGYRMAVLSNKPVRPSRAIVEGLGLSVWMQAVYGGNSFARKKPDPMGIQAIVQELAAEPATTAMIGDSAVDIQAGRAAGVRAYAVTYGFAADSLAQAGPDRSFDRFEDLVEALLSPRSAGEVAK